MTPEEMIAAMTHAVRQLEAENRALTAEVKRLANDNGDQLDEIHDLKQELKRLRERAA
jgi:predicted  nucleic acid-binding Zn-ribbon protein